MPTRKRKRSSSRSFGSFSPSLASSPAFSTRATVQQVRMLGVLIQILEDRHFLPEACATTLNELHAQMAYDMNKTLCPST